MRRLECFRTATACVLDILSAAFKTIGEALVPLFVCYCIGPAVRIIATISTYSCSIANSYSIGSLFTLHRGPCQKPYAYIWSGCAVHFSMLCLISVV